MSTRGGTETNNTKKLKERFSELEDCNEIEQKQKIQEMNEMMDEMVENEFDYVFTIKWFDKIHEMIEEKKMTMKNAILLLKRIGYYQTLIKTWSLPFNKSLLFKKFKKIMEEEESKHEGKNEMLFVDLFECYLLFSVFETSKLLPIYMPRILKVALKKEESEEIQKEVEIALLALRNVDEAKMKKERYLNEIKEIIKHHQEHHNLTRLAYLSAWEFFVNRFYRDKSLEEVFVNELHFVREARRELEELSNCVNWKRKKGENDGEKETKEEILLRRWLQALFSCFFTCELWNEEIVELLASTVKVFRASKDNFTIINSFCICFFESIAENRAVKIDDLLKGGAFDVILEEIQRPTMNNEMACELVDVFDKVLWRLKEDDDDDDDEMEKEKRKMIKRKVFEKMEEEGYEDIIANLYELLYFHRRNHYLCLSFDISDYFVNA